jgi:hypothetical protein
VIAEREFLVPAYTFDASDYMDSKDGWKWKGLKFERRPMWVIEMVQQDKNYIYSKRVGYYDEDSWAPQMADRYDKRGNLWRMYEAYPYSDPCNKMRMIIGYIYMNLESGRYEVFGGCREILPTTTKYDTGLPESYFTVQALRTSGR